LVHQYDDFTPLGAHFLIVMKKSFSQYSLASCSKVWQQTSIQENHWYPRG